MMLRLTKLVLVLSSLIAMPAFAEANTLGHGLSNVMALLNATVAVLWNAKLLVGLVMFVSGFVGYVKLSDPKQNQSQPSILLPVTAMLLGGILVAKGGIDWGSEMFGVEADDNEIIYKQDGRANVAAMAQYEFNERPPSKN